ncbi:MULTISPECIES: DUF6264 family protein [Mycobacterium avium complex (MAC)]|uniref:DUF2637 domain-containing protein n=2 Tax=Mycobacterium avium complex (MAC) TaxID=120793 RepID=A0AAW5S0V0_MYCBC|nr:MULTISPECIES: DUF6264 family protein [Mycobacterium avium complex (MAC)]ETA94817.1 hypothetical protein O984_04590 [Mycobacterium avium 05-4293]ETB13682.1 hypothetical protein P863_04870 [Mycobacterium avium subsp. silvaticum ATCC 49884]ETB20379.1 hypothetical protein O972_03975 [Mycobacterium avium subsp. avium 10-9275]ETB28280.1 hypothetical protein O983_03970 [Mycobacterium avium 09-5983]ETB50983.1 hypothetical protein O974_03000 [Mycobacterium avium 11-0986]EUA39425.1 putative membrane
MPIDDPTTSPRTGDVATTNTADLVATLVLLVVHGGLFAATYVLLGLLVMSTDPCGYQKCGDPAWIDRAMNLNIWAGAALLVLDIAVAVVLLVRRKRAFFVPIIGCLAQVALAVAAAAMELRAGPV